MQWLHIPQLFSPDIWCCHRKAGNPMITMLLQMFRTMLAENTGLSDEKISELVNAFMNALPALLKTKLQACFFTLLLHMKKPPVFLQAVQWFVIYSSVVLSPDKICINFFLLAGITLFATINSIQNCFMQLHVYIFWFRQLSAKAFWQFRRYIFYGFFISFLFR